MKFDAVLFDLFGTLIDFLPSEDYRAVHQQAAELFEVSLESYLNCWEIDRPNRDAGCFGSVEANIRHICEMLNVYPTSEQINQISKARIELIRRNLTPREGAVEVLQQLHHKGYKVGLISDCTHEVSLLWPKTPFAPLMDLCVLSCDVGITKPSPAIFNLACKRLSVDAAKCMFIGDGGSNELAGAQQVGMQPVLIRAKSDHESLNVRIDPNRWTGPRITELHEILSFV